MNLIETEDLPSLYNAWLPDMLGGLIPRESRATCANCAMQQCATSPTPPRDPNFFDPVIKCCSYLPQLPNFLVGRILLDESLESRAGRDSVRARVAAKLAVSPMGLLMPPAYSALYRDIGSGFGRNTALACPHFVKETGGCGIWRHRNAVCSTWFCKFVRGQLGAAFWDELLKLLNQVEDELACWCLLELDPGDEAIEMLLRDNAARFGTDRSEAMAGRVKESDYRAIWGRWLGREETFFRQCGEMVETLTWMQVSALAGQKLRHQLRATRSAYARLVNPTTPENLVAGAFEVVGMKDGLAWLQPGSAYDPLLLPARVLPALAYFDGRDHQAVLADIERELGLRLEPDLVLKLSDFGLLRPPDPPTPPLGL